ncbi:hypothetical protein HPP92_001298 [Vanilla planifolia]|uniref:Uncharacterized protein n=1 Tax=Vanilla planifolia TaxID=51239 RepID=A0A835S7F7_VANPL|nr:hypothetical protein HPP92_001477 [Vanilla planifolia]KAG0501226.1 hypothetical protein HPP92_001298 [Vanilla planifolia]
MPSKKNGIKEPAHSLKVFGQPAKGKRSSSTMQSLEFLKLLLHLLRLLQKPMVSLKNIFLDGLYYHHLKDKCRNATSALGNIVPLSIIDDICVCIGDLLMSTRILQRTRDFLGNFWDKLSGDEAKELVSLKGVNLEELSGSSVIKALTTWKRRPAYLTSLPHFVCQGWTDTIGHYSSISPGISGDLMNCLVCLMMLVRIPFMCWDSLISAEVCFDGKLLECSK